MQDMWRISLLINTVWRLLIITICDHAVLVKYWIEVLLNTYNDKKKYQLSKF